MSDDKPPPYEPPASSGSDGTQPPPYEPPTSGSGYEPPISGTGYEPPVSGAGHDPAAGGSVYESASYQPPGPEAMPPPGGTPPAGATPPPGTTPPSGTTPPPGTNPPPGALPPPGAYPPGQTGQPGGAYAPPAPVQGGKDNTILFGILSIIFAVVCCPLIGVLFGWLAMNEGKKTGSDALLGKIGFWLGIAFTALAVVGGLIAICAGGMSGNWHYDRY